MTLDWLLILGAIAALAAGSVLAVQIVVDDSSDLPDRPDVRVADAEIAAAIVAFEATKIVRANPDNYNDTTNEVFKMRCQNVANEYSDVVQDGDWHKPSMDELARCVLRRV